VLALLIGALAIFAGGQVLLGRDPGYYVIDWLPIYNFAAGLLSVLLIAPLIWRRSRYALPASLVTFGAHAAVMVILQTAYGAVVAPDSIMAMTVRLTVWAIILTLLFVQSRRDQRLSAVS
jgi:hypothetical protein